MIVTFPLRHRSLVVPDRRRRVIPVWDTREVSVDVREIEGAEAPVVLEARFAPGASMSEVETIPVRAIGGLLHRPSTSFRSGGGGPAERSLRGALEAFAHDACLARDDEDSVDPWLRGESVRIDAPEGRRRLERSSFEGVAAALQEMVDGRFVVVDGVLHERVGASPVFATEFFAAFGDDGRVLAAMLTGDVVCSWLEPRAEELVRTIRSVPTVDMAVAGDLMRRFDVRVVDAGLRDACREEAVRNTDFSLPLLSEISGRGAEWKRLPTSDRHRAVVVGGNASRCAPGTSGADVSAAWIRATEAVACYRPDGNASDASVPADPATPVAGGVRAMFPYYQIPQIERDPENWYAVAGRRTTGLAEILVGEASPSVPDLVVVVGKNAGAGWAEFVLHDGAFHVLSEAGIGRAGDDGVPLVESRHHVAENAPGGYALAEILADEAWELGQTGRRSLFDPVYQKATTGEPARVPKGGSVDAFKKRVLARYAAERLTVFGDRLAMRCPEPVAVVRPRLTAPGVDVSASWSWRQRGTPGANPPYLFRLDDHDEAVRFAGRFGMQVRGGASKPEIADVSCLRFDAESWNIKVAASSILDGLDGRIWLLDEADAVVVGRLDAILRAWRADASSADDPETGQEIVAATWRLLGIVDDPVFDGVGSVPAREMAAECIVVLAARNDRGPEVDEEDYVDLTM